MSVFELIDIGGCLFPFSDFALRSRMMMVFADLGNGNRSCL